MLLGLAQEHLVFGILWHISPALLCQNAAAMPKPKGQLVPPHVQRNLPYEPAEWSRWSRGDIGELTHLLRCYEPCVSIDSGEAYTKQAIQVAMCLCGLVHNSGSTK